MTLSRLKKTITTLLALLHAWKDNVLPFEEPELDADDDLNETERAKLISNPTDSKEAGEQQQQQATFYFIKRLRQNCTSTYFFI